MTIMLAAAHVAAGADEGTYWKPYFVGGGILLLLLLLIAALLAFGRGREHS
ncbi:MAG TPA: hypothetical protein VFE15_02515 [Marmoricola sp.]|jgi:hypothetical protein|nr:hypothetical protein [Marmoricola sp.]